jgi:hypothetical protein
MDASRDASYLRRNGERKRDPEKFDRILTDFEIAGEKIHVGRLWDLSTEGACMQLLGQVKIEENAIGNLRFRHVDTLEEVELVAEVCWLDSTDRRTLVGLVFAKKLENAGHFLAPHL